MRRTVAAACTAALVLTACDGGDASGDSAAEATPEAAPDAAPDEGEPGGSEPTAGDEPPTDAGPASQPEWSQPPATSIGASVGVAPEPVITDDVAVALDRVVAHAEGVELSVTVREREAPEAEDGPEAGGPFDPPTEWIESDEDQLPDEVMVVEIALPDGDVLSTADEFVDPPEPGEEPDGPSLVAPLGSGMDGVWDQELWLWSAPVDDGDLEVRMLWPAEDIEHTVALDGEDLAAATDGAVSLWDDAA